MRLAQSPHCLLEFSHQLQKVKKHQLVNAVVTVKLTLPIATGNIILPTLPHLSVVGCIFPLSASRTQWVNTETSYLGSNPGPGHASARRGADCKTSV